MTAADGLRTDRTRLRRLPARGSHDRDELYAVLDAGFVCHLGFAADEGPRVIPTLYGRDGDRLLLHGSAASRALRAAAGGLPVCVTVTHVDALVLARSAFHHSMNYRSAIVYGTAVPVEGPEKRRALEAVSEHVAPGRWAQVRPPSAKEIRVTTVLALPLDEASVKTRSGPPGDDDEDLGLDVWAGIVPFASGPLAPEPDELTQTRPGLPAPAYRRPPAA